ncbi:pectinesterase 1-like [Cornus florida]|uniref:pectinesterase 1-like n=1 Tax=Cornus florida TaxID=4283 RepID=UPI0028A21A33|nr:pectinesterase 1-like [Cornus florida]
MTTAGAVPPSSAMKRKERGREALDLAFVTAESGGKVIKGRKDGKSDFKTVTDTGKSISDKNTSRVIVWIGGGNYIEEIRINRSKPLVTFYGAPNDMPMLVYDDIAKECGTVDSATLIVESVYFTAVNLVIVNSAPRPDGRREGAQTVSLRISGDKAVFYIYKVYGFQDTICDDKGKHFCDVFVFCHVPFSGIFCFCKGNFVFLYFSCRIPWGVPGVSESWLGYFFKFGIL